MPSGRFCNLLNARPFATACRQAMHEVIDRRWEELLPVLFLILPALVAANSCALPRPSSVLRPPQSCALPCPHLADGSQAALVL